MPYSEPPAAGASSGDGAALGADKFGFPRVHAITSESTPFSFRLIRWHRLATSWASVAAIGHSTIQLQLVAFQACRLLG